MLSFIIGYLCGGTFGLMLGVLLVGGRDDD